MFLTIIAWTGVVAAAVLSAADAMLTAMILDAGGVEKNQITRWFIRKMGTTVGLGLPKLTSMVFVAWCVYNFVEFWWAGILAAGVFGYISWRNFNLWTVLNKR